jgi:hypothetical protein
MAGLSPTSKPLRVDTQLLSPTTIARLADAYTACGSKGRLTSAKDGLTRRWVERLYDRVVATSRRSHDPHRIAAAQITGIVERCVAGRGLTGDQALVAIGAALGPVAELSWPRVLADAAASFVDSDEAWRQAALQLLVRAGVDVGEARRQRDTRPSNYSGRFTH